MVLQGNARQLYDKRCDGSTRLGKLSKLGLAPVLCCTIFLLLTTYIHAVILGTSPNPLVHNQLCLISFTLVNVECPVKFLFDSASTLPKLTAAGALFAWLGVFLATAGLVTFYRCSRYFFMLF